MVGSPRVRHKILEPSFACCITPLVMAQDEIRTLSILNWLVVWKPVALPGEHELYVVREFKKGEPAGSNGPRLRDWQKLTSFTGVSGVCMARDPRGPRGAEAVICLRVFTGAMRVFRPELTQGRAFTAEEESRAEPVARVQN